MAITLPNGIKLTRKQREFCDLVVNTLSGPYPELHCITLAGAAGTGKTTVLGEAIRQAKEAGYRCLVTAPTHKAVSVLEGKLTDVGITDVSTGTLHSVLKIKPKDVPPGQPEEFTQTGQPRFDGYDLLIVDEASMVGRSLLHYVLKDCIGQITVLFAGDMYQLRPVGENSRSPVFSTSFLADTNAGLTHTLYKLTKVLRHDGAILDKATELRKSTYLRQIGPAKGENSEIAVYDEAKFLKTAWLFELKNKQNKGGDLSQTVMLCYKNDNRRAMNAAAREMLYDSDVPDYMAGDRVVTLNAWNGRAERFIANNCSLEVVDTEYLEGFRPVTASEESFDCWKLEVKVEGSAVPCICYALANHERARFKKRLAALAKDIKKAGSSSLALHDTGSWAAVAYSHKSARTHKARWAMEFFPLKEFFIDIDFDYARTIHKSQGSTFESVYIWNDYSVSRSESVSLAYVAFTRASRIVHHLDTRHPSARGSLVAA